MSKNKCVGIIQARMSSSRLPGKVLKLLAGEPMLVRIHDRLLQCKHIDKVIVATSTELSDDSIFDLCKIRNIDVFRGSLNNVQKRFIDIIDKYNSKYYARITGDCPFIFPQFIDAQIKALEKHSADTLWFKEESSLLEGQGVFSSSSLKFIFKKSNDINDKEHVGSIYLANNPQFFKIVEMKLPDYFIKYKYRLTVDEEPDYIFASKLYDAFQDTLPFNFMELVSFLEKNNYLSMQNKNIKHRQLNTDLAEKRKKWINAKKLVMRNLKY